MYTVIVEFRKHKPVALEDAQNIFASTAPKYQNVQGLLRKTYICSEDGCTLGGVYFWRSKKEAEAMYTKEWYAFVREKYNTEPIVSHFESPVVVDNVSHEILTD